jgi:rubrerythrin
VDNRFDEGDFNVQEAMLSAMNAEKASYKLYTDLANMTDDADLKETFLALAQEEAKHKLQFEIDYDNQIFQEN